MRSIGIILAVIVAGLAAYIIYGLVSGGGTAYASTGGDSVLNRTSASNAQSGAPGKATFVPWNRGYSGLGSSVANAVEKITGQKVLGFQDTKNTWSDGKLRTA